MEAVIPTKGVKTFYHILQCLTKIGEHLFLEITPEKIRMSTLNQNRSAFIGFNLDPRYFEEYNYHTGAESLLYRVNLKACEYIFRSYKSVEQCKLVALEDDDVFTFDMMCKMGLKKTCKLDVEEGEPLQAIYDRATFPNRIRVRPKVFRDYLANFHSTLREVTFRLDHDEVYIRSYVDDQNEDSTSLSKRCLHTDLRMNVEEFDKYEFTTERVSLTFSYKEMMAVLNFCELQTHPITLYLGTEGKPLLVSLSIPNAFDADFVLATLLEPEEQDASGSTQSGSTYTQSQVKSEIYSPSPSYPNSSISSSMEYSASPISTFSSQTPSTVGYRRKYDGFHDDTPQKKRKFSNDSDDEVVWADDLGL
eukprot:TRINITY_DN7534_c0_g1_i1.p1 TRINITY_DN7534_c0_g1~~TRINITY_DN7534_c0_g1_i1.p1  ORF type:complete len:363 (-),score=62.65 TRINITY_DN7534_c0_g1_i1:38-1126(-)